MFAWIRTSYTWMERSLYSPYADTILGILFYLEAIFFLPTDPLLIFFCLERTNHALRAATIALIGSVMGGMTSYMIGFTLRNYCGDQIIHNHWFNLILTPAQFFKLAVLFQEYEWSAILAAGFTPIAYKAATIAAGFCNLSFIPFVICSIIARGARFYLIAILCLYYGARIKDSFHSYYNLMLMGTVLIVALSLWLFT